MARVIFLLINVSSFSFSDWWATQQNAWQIDFSAIAYLLIIPLLLYFLNQLFVSQIWSKLLRAYFVLALLSVALISSVDVLLYKEWNTKFNIRALDYLRHPDEIFRTAGWGYILLFLFLVFCLFFLGYSSFKKERQNAIFQIQYGKISFLFFPIWIAVFVILIRGGLQQIPLQESDAYFSKNQKLNDAAVNPFWNFMASVVHKFKTQTKNPYHYFSDEELAKFPLAHLSSSQHILKTERPNIVFIILEGWSSDMLGANNSDLPQSCSPCFDSLTKQGLFFSNAYASGERSDQGVTAILTSFPALPLGAIINDPKNIPALPSISTELKKAGYSTLFLFGGQLSYGNLKALIYQKNFDSIIEEKDLDKHFYRGRLGVHDENTFNVFNQKISELKQPFFAAFFTQSTHFHYDYPHTKNTIKWANDQNDYANSIFYSDSCLGNFIRKAKNEKWFSNTLFVILPDHSHRSPHEWARYTAEFHHIPILFFGDVIADSLRGKRIDYPVSQCGVSATVLQQMSLQNANFKWGNNLLNEENPQAFFVFTEGVGLVNQNGNISFDASNKKVMQFSATNNDTATWLAPAKAFLQRIGTN
ncbi:MAG TPA: LTA synthase family protein [Chitinophagales bacterium]